MDQGEQEMARDRVADAIREWAAPDPELGWAGCTETAEHAQELADFLWERGLTASSES